MSSLFITIIQSDLHWENKQANLDLFEQKILSLPEQSSIVILPEMFTTGFSMKASALAETMDGPSIAWMRKMASTKKVVLTGSLIIEENGNYFNRLIWMLPTGEMGHYDKRHLFGYSKENEHYQAGNQRLITSVNGWKINLQICYDLRFPVWSRQQSKKDHEEMLPEYDLLIYVANWPERRSHAWKTLLSARAIENQCFVAGVNRVGTDGNGIYHSGDSMIVDPLGEALFHVADQENIFTIELKKQGLNEIRERFPFLKDGDAFTIHSQ